MEFLLYLNLLLRAGFISGADPVVIALTSVSAILAPLEVGVDNHDNVAV